MCIQVIDLIFMLFRPIVLQNCVIISFKFLLHCRVIIGLRKSIKNRSSRLFTLFVTKKTEQILQEKNEAFVCVFVPNTRFLHWFSLETHYKLSPLGGSDQPNHRHLHFCHIQRIVTYGQKNYFLFEDRKRWYILIINRHIFGWRGDFGSIIDWTGA